jgi:ring-1,2-phenylacetyl-CoA epoxidase subunit PaaA
MSEADAQTPPDSMGIEEYLARGGRLTAPGNAPPRYRAELLRLMATFVDSELAGAAGFADVINDGPGLKARIAASRIVLEKTDHAERVLKLMAEFGVDVTRYEQSHPWAARLPRDADIGARRSDHDMRLAVFNYPLDGWVDAVVMNLLMGLAADEQLTDAVRVSYQPLAEVMTAIAPRERRHTTLAEEGVAQLVAQGARDAAQASVAYWWPRVSASFGTGASDRMPALQALGLRHRTGEAQRAAWAAAAKARLVELGLTPPPD